MRRAGTMRVVFQAIGAAAVGGLALVQATGMSRGDEPSLKRLAPKGLLIGAALSARQVEGGDPVSLGIVTRQFNSISPEDILKWEAVHPAPERYVFEPVDKYVALGKEHGLAVIGHVLVWHQQTPAWVFAGQAGGRADRDTLLSRMRTHIQMVVGRYRDRIHGWDVVNEALDDDGTLRKTPWLEAIGPDYVAKAFEYTHAADPAAELYYNDFNLWKPAKREAAIRLVKDLRAGGLRVDGIGEQAHWGIDEPPLAEIDRTIAETAAGSGVKVLLTELDIDVLPRDPDMWGADLSKKATIRATTNIYPDGLPDAQQQALARRYADIFTLVLKHRGVVSRVTFWGVTDAQSWLHNFPIPGRVNYPLLWDRQGQPKRAFDAVVEVLRGAR
jgi:endo-1,4-beta-xylanase